MFNICTTHAYFGYSYVDLFIYECKQPTTGLYGMPQFMECQELMASEDMHHKTLVQLGTDKHIWYIPHKPMG